MTKEQIEALGITYVEGMTDEEVVAKITSKQNEFIAKQKSDKNLIDKYSSEIAGLKKEKNDKLTSEEQTQLHIKELEESLAKEKRTNAERAKVETYMGIGYSKELAEKVALAELDGKDTSKYHQEFIKAHDEALKAELMKANPSPDGGAGGSDKTIEDKFKAGTLSMDEVSALKGTNPALYNKLLGIENN